ncbi:MAG: hypothetical protein GKR94_24050 [Gammaproteobacteria bacterium]|nr:hypothetical protein [Gammaproteobacteria bacterium]
MSQAEVVKEKIAYLKFWLGILVVLGISLVGWLLTNAGTESDLKAGGAAFGAAIITVAALFVHKKIEYLISTLEDL